MVPALYSPMIGNSNFPSRHITSPEMLSGGQMDYGELKTMLNEHSIPVDDDGRPCPRSNRRRRVCRHYVRLRFHELKRTNTSLMIANCVDFHTSSEHASYSKVSATIHDGHPQRCLLRKRQNIRERGWKVSKLKNKVPNGVESRTVPQRSFPPQEL